MLRADNSTGTPEAEAKGQRSRGPVAKGTTRTRQPSTASQPACQRALVDLGPVHRVSQNIPSSQCTPMCLKTSLSY